DRLLGLAGEEPVGSRGLGAATATATGPATTAAAIAATATAAGCVRRAGGQRCRDRDAEADQFEEPATRRPAGRQGVAVDAAVVHADLHSSGAASRPRMSDVMLWRARSGVIRGTSRLFDPGR